MPDGRRIPTFFYGSFINVDVLRRGGFDPKHLEMCKLHGFDITIERLATLVPSENSTVYGVLAYPTHDELRKLYGQEWVGSYLPEPVVVCDPFGSLKVALCYISTRTPERPQSDYIEWIIQPARNLKFPDWYLAKLESWR